MSNCNITELTSDYFGATSPQNLSSLLNISLRNNSLETIGNASFIRVENLEELDLSRNKIQFLERAAFEGLGELEELRLDHNRLTLVDWDVFEPCNTLFNLELNNNLVKTLTSHENTILSSIGYLNLGTNKIEDVSSLSHLPRLQKLWLRSNQKLSLNQNSFSKNPEISTLELTDTGLNTSNGFEFLANTKNLQELWLDRNNISGMKFFNLIPTLRGLRILHIRSCDLVGMDLELLELKFPRLKIDKVHNVEHKCDQHVKFDDYLEDNVTEINRKKPSKIDIDNDDDEDNDKNGSGDNAGANGQPIF
jgi:Leucine-rich repeat (LRR) protein